MRNIFDVSIDEKSMIEYSDFLNSILKSPTPHYDVLNMLLLVSHSPISSNIAEFQNYQN